MSGPALSSELRRLVALGRRDVRIQFTYQFQLLLLLSNIPFVVFTYYFLGKLVGHPAALSSYRAGYFEFALVGFIVMSFATVGMSAFRQTIADEQDHGTLAILLSCSETRLGTVLAGALVVPLALATLQSAALLVIGWTVSDGGFDAGGLVLTVPLLILTVASFCAVGIASAACLILAKRGDPFSGLAVEATNLIAGALFPVTLLPGPLRAAARMMPAFYGFNGIREVLLTSAGLRDIVGDIAVLAAFVAVLLPLALRMFSSAVRVSQVSGTLGSF